MAAVDIESVIKRGVERALNEPIMNGKSVMQWAEIGIHSQEQSDKDIDVPSKPEIVRCKDCKHYKDGTGMCSLYHAHGCAETWFCADGEGR